MNRLILILGLMLGGSSFFIASAQPFANTEPAKIRQGNKRYQVGDFTGAEESYRSALDKNANSDKGIFNLGDAYYQQERYEEAAQQFGLAVKMAEDEAQKAKAFHNMGNAQMGLKQYDKSVDAYKNALRLNPADEDTRYNLAYAQQMLQNQQNQDQENQDQENEDKENEDKENQDKQDQDQENEDQQEQEDQQDQEDSDESQESEGQKPQNMSKEEIARMLEALQYEEDKLQQELQQKKARGQRQKIEKDW